MFKSICRSIRFGTTKTTTTTTKSRKINKSCDKNVQLQFGSTSTTSNLTHSPGYSLRTDRRSLSNCQQQLVRAMSSGEAAAPKHTNRLAQSKSPYLLQHAHNPVDWYPWCDEAIEKARKENKLIFLSVGYSTCHWCHVMERESFENEEVAAIMNENFICIKVDREERPDIDRIYMQFVVMMNGSGGWPMSVWLTPDLAPITAGTYFPPKDRWGMPSFTTILKTISEKWRKNNEELRTTGLEVIAAIRRSVVEKSSELAVQEGSVEAKLQDALSVFKKRYDELHGGFGSKPKFPEVARLNFLFHAYINTKDAQLLNMVLDTLHHIGNGGINDHVFGGFARYSVDQYWHVPHFEKMLYDQGQLMAAYASAYKLTRREEFLTHADGIFRYIMKDLRHPLGGFFAGEDADSLPTADDTVKVEGAFYSWKWEDVKNAIKANAECYDGLDPERVFEIYSFHYDLRPRGNVEPESDPHHHLANANILIRRGSEEETSSKFDISPKQLNELLQTTNKILHEIRDKRPRPHLDTKIICSWNGLMLSGLAKLANCGSEKREIYLEAAGKLYEFLRKHIFDEERKMLLRACYGNGINDPTLQSADVIDGFLDDYAFLIKGLLDYYKASLDDKVLHWAKELQDIQDKLFWDDTQGAYFYSHANSAHLIVRLKEDHDGAEPCGNSVAARNLILLSHYYDDQQYMERAGKLFEFYADTVVFGYNLPEMMSALLLREHGLDLVAVVGTDSETTQRFVEVCRKFYIPGMIILHVDPAHPDAAYNQRIQQKFKMINGKTTVYMCHDRVCRMPVTDVEALEANLQDKFLYKETISAK